MYYIKNKNDEIILAANDKKDLINTLIFKPELNESDILETDENYTIYDFELMTEEEKEKKVKAKEEDRINNLTMTPLDFIKALQTLGLTLNQINEYLESNLEVETQLKYCQNVYCRVVKQLCPITLGEITLTCDMVESLFRAKDEDI